MCRVGDRNAHGISLTLNQAIRGLILLAFRMFLEENSVRSVPSHKIFRCHYSDRCDQVPSPLPPHGGTSVCLNSTRSVPEFAFFSRKEEERHGNPVLEGFKDCCILPGSGGCRPELRPISDPAKSVGVRLQPVSSHPPCRALPQTGDHGLVLGRFREDDM